MIFYPLQINILPNYMFAAMHFQRVWILSDIEPTQITNLVEDCFCGDIESTQLELSQL